jgi:hypothetical protein
MSITALRRTYQRLDRQSNCPSPTVTLKEPLQRFYLGIPLIIGLKCDHAHFARGFISYQNVVRLQGSSS